MPFDPRIVRHYYDAAAIIQAWPRLVSQLAADKAAAKAQRRESDDPDNVSQLENDLQRLSYFLTYPIELLYHLDAHECLRRKNNKPVENLSLDASLQDAAPGSAAAPKFELLRKCQLKRNALSYQDETLSLAECAALIRGWLTHHDM